MHKIVVAAMVVFLGIALLASACRQPQATLTPEANLRALIDSSRSQTPPELRAAAKFDLSAQTKETTSPDKHTMTVDPSVKYKTIILDFRPFEDMKGTILNAPRPQQ